MSPSIAAFRSIQDENRIHGPDWAALRGVNWLHALLLAGRDVSHGCPFNVWFLRAIDTTYGVRLDGWMHVVAAIARG